MLFPPSLSLLYWLSLSHSLFLTQKKRNDASSWIADILVFVFVLFFDLLLKCFFPRGSSQNKHLMDGLVHVDEVLRDTHGSWLES